MNQEWIEMPLGTEVNLCPGGVILDGVAAPLPLKETHQPPSYRPMSIMALVAHLNYC